MGLPFYVLSGGFKEGIMLTFSNAGVIPPPIFANMLECIGGRIQPHFTLLNPECDKPFGVCGNCKALHIRRLKASGGRIVYIGDGLTDRCAAVYADILFAKNDLARYCDENCIKYIKYDDFYDIEAALYDGASGI